MVRSTTWVNETHFYIPIDYRCPAQEEVNTGLTWTSVRSELGRYLLYLPSRGATTPFCGSGVSRGLIRRGGKTSFRIQYERSLRAYELIPMYTPIPKGRQSSIWRCSIRVTDLRSQALPDQNTANNGRGLLFRRLYGLFSSPSLYSSIG